MELRQRRGYFHSLLQWTDGRLRQNLFSAQTLPTCYSSRLGKADLALTSSFWKNPYGTEAKCAYLRGPRAEIVNLMIYPANAQSVPIFAVELILFGQMPRVAVIDLQAAAGVQQNFQLVAEIRQSLEAPSLPLRSRLGAGGELPEWAISHFSPTCVYSRPRDLSELPTVFRAYRLFLNAWIRDFLPRENGLIQARADLAHYQHHHVENTPGRRFLHTSFGEEWTEGFLRDFMYTSNPPKLAVK